MSLKKIILNFLIASQLVACVTIQRVDFDPNLPIEKKSSWLGTGYHQNGHPIVIKNFNEAIKNNPEAQRNFELHNFYEGVTYTSAMIIPLEALLYFLVTSGRHDMAIVFGVTAGVAVGSSLLADHYFDNAVDNYNQKIKPKQTAYLLNYSWQF